MSGKSTRQERNSNIIKRHPLATYFILAFGLAWWPWPLTLVNPKSVAMIPWAPLIAALIVTSIVAGRHGVKGLLAATVRWRAKPRWYAVALLLPVVVTLAAVYLNVLLGAPAPTAAQLAEWYVILPGFISTLLLAGPLTEEPGWRGFALPRLQERRSALAASLILGVVWATWHLPLLVSDATGQRPPAQYFLMILAQSVLLTWLYNNTKGSVFLAILFHAAANTVAAFFFQMYIGEAYYQQLWWLYAGIYSIVALSVVVSAGYGRLTRREQAPIAEPVGDLSTRTA